MRIKRKYIWIPIAIIVLIISIITVYSLFQKLSYTKEIPLILGIDSADSEYLEGDESWTASYKVYRLSDETVKRFLEKEKKNLYDLDGYKKLNWRKGSMDSLSYVEYAETTKYKDYKSNLNHYEKLDSSYYYKYYNGQLGYRDYMDSINYRNDLETLSYIEEYSFEPFNNSEKANLNSEKIKSLFYNNSYYSLHYKRMDMFLLYILDEENKLLYISSLWI